MTSYEVFPLLNRFFNYMTQVSFYFQAYIFCDDVDTVGKQLMCDQYGEFFANGDFTSGDITSTAASNLANIAEDGNVAGVDPFDSGLCF